MIECGETMPEVRRYSSIHFTAVAPGRVNLLGEHVDYNGGAVLPVAIDRAVHLSVNSVPDQQVTLRARDLNKVTAFRLDQLETRRDLNGDRLPGWAMYPAGVAWSLQQLGLDVRGLSGEYYSDIPIGAGLSSSAAVELAFAVAWQQLGGWNLDGLQLARACQRAEVEYVGVNCGIMDQFASAMGVKDHVLWLDTQNLAWEALPLPAGSAIVIADSGIRRSLSNSEYNRRHTECEAALKILQRFLPGIHSLAEVSPHQFEIYAHELPELLRKRARYVVGECYRVRLAVPLLKAGDASAFGQLMYATHAGLRDDYQVSISELDQLVEIASHLPGCRGARLTGAGFGGCTVNLVDESQAEGFIESLTREYQQATKRVARVYLCHASKGAHVISS